ncbi:CYFA0S04e04170g1_1 [Cyberlindnera fabianii]|uniref:CYFA0S04e04170g1_1 n=1 Tax=Cyberlindnera fabianii TaxID=36022 RepID=A0A061AR59_CYBFA|nr:CYFA0S04e04170g1_1 [Cyberlindnera fabianii]
MFISRHRHRISRCHPHFIQQHLRLHHTTHKMTLANYVTDRSTPAEYETHIARQLQVNKEHLASLTHPGSAIKLPYGNGPAPQTDGPIFFFDIDNCLYKRSLQIHDLMQQYIHDYFVRRLDLSDEDAMELQLKYYRTYGLAIQGLVKYHKIDGLEYNAKVDDALPLQEILHPDEKLRDMLIKLRGKGHCDRLWLFTNAYKNHGERCVRLLGIGDLFEGLSFCDYGKMDFVCKPQEQAFHRALKEAGGKSFENCYFVDDSAANIATAVKLGFKKAVHFVERDEDLGTTPEGAILIRDILDLPQAVPELFE